MTENGAAEKNAVTPQELRERMPDNEAVSVDEMTAMFHEGQRHCPECDRTTDSWSETRESVRSALMDLLHRGMVSSTPEWDYRLAAHPDNGGAGK